MDKGDKSRRESGVGSSLEIITEDKTERERERDGERHRKEILLLDSERYRRI